MSQFDTALQGSEHRFVREDPKMLKNMFGSEGLAPFWIADMEFKIADPISKEFQRLAERGVYAYEFATQDIFKAITKWNQDRHQLNLDEKAFIQVPSVLTGIALLVWELSRPGDGVLIQTPVYHQFAVLIKGADRKIVRNPLKIVDGRYEMDFEDLENKLKSGGVKIMLLCNPHNPVGRVWRREELERVKALADEYGVTIISDEIHADIIYSGHTFNSLASLGPSGHIAVLGSPAKTFGMQSISNGYLYITEKELSQRTRHTVESMYLNHGNAFSTFGTIAAYRYGAGWLDDMIAYLERTIHWIDNYIETEMPGVKMYPVEGTYQVWLDFRALNISPEELQTITVEKARLALTPGSWFDRDSGLFMRMNIASPLYKIKTAFMRLSHAINESV